MATTLGDAAIRIALDPRLAKQELDKLSQEIERIDRAKEEQARELKDLGSRTKAAAAGVERVSSRSRGKTEGTAQNAIDTINDFMRPIRIAADAGEFLFPKLGQALKSGSKGTVFESSAKNVDSKIQAVAKAVTEVRAQLESYIPTLTKVVEFNIASLRLGGRLPPDQDDLLKQVYAVENAQQLMQRSMKREIDNQTIDSLIRGVKALQGGGN